MQAKKRSPGVFVSSPLRFFAESAGADAAGYSVVVFLRSSVASTFSSFA
jgi:hypothetical protein